MGFLDQLKAVWPLVMQAPWGFVPVAVALLFAAWATGRFMYGERIATLESRIVRRDEIIAELNKNKAEPDAEIQLEIARIEDRTQRQSRELRTVEIKEVNVQVDKVYFSINGPNGGSDVGDYWNFKVKVHSQKKLINAIVQLRNLTVKTETGWSGSLNHEAPMSIGWALGYDYSFKPATIVEEETLVLFLLNGNVLQLFVKSTIPKFGENLNAGHYQIDAMLIADNLDKGFRQKIDVEWDGTGPDGLKIKLIGAS